VEVHVVPQILGGGERLFDNLGGVDLRLDQVRTTPGVGVTHLTYRIVT
jgi:hypothetical protein